MDNGTLIMSMTIRRGIPNAITLGNLAAGAAGIWMVAQGEVITASWMVLLAALLDLLDGMMARALGVESALGKDLDSLADLVSFGLLPGMLMAWFIAEAGGDAWMGYLALILLPVAAAYRLARFNNDPSQKYGFRGLPAPGNGLLLGTWPLGIVYGRGWGMNALEYIAENPTFILVISLLAAALMASRLPLLSFKLRGWKEPANIWRLAIVLAALLMLIFFGMAALPLAVLLYLVLGSVAGLGKARAKIQEIDQ